MVGIGLKLVSVLLFMIMSACLKLVGDLPTGQLLFFRFLFGMVPLLIMLGWHGQVRQAFRTHNPLGHLWRGVVGGVSMGFSFYALTRLPLVDAVVLSYAMPLFVIVLGAFCLHESVSPFKWVCVLLGLAGVAFISAPNVTFFSGGSDGFSERTFGIIAALVGSILAAVAMLLVKQLVRTERSSTIVLWFSLTTMLFSLLTVFDWEEMHVEHALPLLASGILGGIAQVLMTESYRHADASTIAPFEYISVIVSIILGYLIFGDVPTVHMVGGGTIVVFAGLLLCAAEIWQSRNRRKEAVSH